MKNKKNKGFTLIELIMGITIFLLVLGGLVGVFIYSLRLQRKILKKQQVLAEVALFDMEFMTKNLRMAKRQEDETCLSPDIFYESINGGEGIKFLNKLQEEGDTAPCQSLFLAEESGRGVLKYCMDEACVNDGGSSAYSLTSPDIDVLELDFLIQGQVSGDELQPKVTITIKFTHKDFDEVIFLQTTVSQRNLDIDTSS